MIATIGVTVIDGTGAVHARVWPVPPHLAAHLAAQLTATFGPPDEMVSTVEAMEAGGQHAAEHGAVFLLDPEGGSHG